MRFNKKTGTFNKIISLVMISGLLCPSTGYSNRPAATADSILAERFGQDILSASPLRSEARRVTYGFDAPEIKTTHSFASYNVGKLFKKPLNVIPDEAVNAVRAFLKKAIDKQWLKGAKVVDVAASDIKIHVSHNFGTNNADVHRIMLEAVRAGLHTMKKQLTIDPDAISALDLEKAIRSSFGDHPFKERKGTAESVEVAMGVNVDISAFNNTAYDLFANLDFNPAMTLSGDKIRGVRFYIQKREDILQGRTNIKVLEISQGENGEPDVNQMREIKILLAQNENVLTAVYPVHGRAFEDPEEPLMTVIFQPAFGSEGEPVLNPTAIFRGQSGGPPVGAVGHTVANTRFVLGGPNADHYVAVRPFTQEEARRPIKDKGIGGFVMYGYEQAGNGFMPRNGYISDYFGLSPSFLHAYIKKAKWFAKVMLAHLGFQPYLHPRAAAKRAAPARHELNSRFINVVKDFEPDPVYQDVERRVQAGELIKITSGKADYGALNGHTKAPALYTALERAYLAVMKEKGLIGDYFTLAQDPKNKMERVQLEKNYAVGDDTHMTVMGGKAEDVQVIIKRAMAIGPVFHMLAFKDTDQPDKPGIGTYGLLQDLVGSDKEAIEKDPFGWLGLADASVTERFFELANQLADQRDINAGVIRSLYDQWKAWKQTPASQGVQEIVRGSGNTSAQGIGVAYQYMDPKKDGGYAELDADKMGPQSKNILWFHILQKALKDYANGLVAEIWDLKAFDEDGNIAVADLPKNWSDISYLVRSALKAKEPRITKEDAEWLKTKAYAHDTLASDIDYARLGNILKHIGFVPSKRIFMDVATELDKIELLLGDSDRFNVKAGWSKKKSDWDPHYPYIEDYLDRPVAMSTVSRLGLLAGGEYVGKDDDKVMGQISFMQYFFDYLRDNPWLLQGDMNGSHQLWAMLLPVKEAVATLNSAPIAVALINHFSEDGQLIGVTDVFESKAFDKQRKAAGEFNLDFISAQRATNPHLAHREQVEGAYAIEAISAALDAPESPFWLDKLRAAKPGQYPEPVSADAVTLYTAVASDAANKYQELLTSRSEARSIPLDKLAAAVDSMIPVAEAAFTNLDGDGRYVRDQFSRKIRTIAVVYKEQYIGAIPYGQKNGLGRQIVDQLNKSALSATQLYKISVEGRDIIVAVEPTRSEARGKQVKLADGKTVVDLNHLFKIWGVLTDLVLKGHEDTLRELSQSQTTVHPLSRQAAIEVAAAAARMNGSRILTPDGKVENTETERLIHAAIIPQPNGRSTGNMGVRFLEDILDGKSQAALLEWGGVPLVTREPVLKDTVYYAIELLRTLAKKDQNVLAHLYEKLNNRGYQMPPGVVSELTRMGFMTEKGDFSAAYWILKDALTFDGRRVQVLDPERILQPGSSNRSEARVFALASGELLHKITAFLETSARTPLITREADSFLLKKAQAFLSEQARRGLRDRRISVQELAANVFRGMSEEPVSTRPEELRSIVIANELEPFFLNSLYRISSVNQTPTTSPFITLKIGEEHLIGDQRLQVATITDTGVVLRVTPSEVPSFAAPAGTPSRSEARVLVLSRKLGESIIIGENIVITVVEIRGGKVRLSIQAPTEIPVHRQEVYEAIQRQQLKEKELSDKQIATQIRETSPVPDQFRPENRGNRSEARRVAPAPSFDQIKIPSVSLEARNHALGRFTASIGEPGILTEGVLQRGEVWVLGTVLSAPVNGVVTQNPELVQRVQEYARAKGLKVIVGGTVAEVRSEVRKAMLEREVSPQGLKFRGLSTPDDTPEIRAELIRELGQAQVSLIVSFDRMAQELGISDQLRSALRAAFTVSRAA